MATLSSVTLPSTVMPPVTQIQFGDQTQGSGVIAGHDPESLIGAVNPYRSLPAIAKSSEWENVSM